MKTALFIDIAGKQDYVFSSNKLKENVGASFIMREQVLSANLFKKHLPDSAAYDEAYIGGGNAMLFFKDDKDDAKAFVKSYSKAVLKAYPGLQLSFGFGEYELKEDNTDNWKACIKQCIESANLNRSLHFMESKPFKPGIVADCPLSGDAQEVYNVANKKWYSKGIQTKVDASNNAHEEFNTRYADALTKEFTMPKEIEDINIASEKNYVSIIHIDGNRMGKQFQNIDSLEKYKVKSKKVRNKLQGAMKELIKYVVERCPNGKFAENTPYEIRLKDETKKDKNGELQKIYTLPFRPIINAGDDITFVCHGNLAIPIAEKYMEILNDNGISTCAGIAIVKRHYPFFRAYELADNLATEAKKMTRKEDTEKNLNSCWLNFMIAPQGYTGNFDSMLNNSYPNEAHGPYCVIDNGQAIAKNPTLKKLKENLYHLAYDENDKWPRNKLLKIRNTLTKSEADKQLLIAELNAKDRFFSSEKDANSELKKMKDFPYFDLVELINFYPDIFLKEEFETIKIPANV